MPLANLQEYWSRNNVSYIPFYSETFTRNRFSQIFWILHLTTIPKRNSKESENTPTTSKLLFRLHQFKILGLFHTGRANMCGRIDGKIQGPNSSSTIRRKRQNGLSEFILQLTQTLTTFVAFLLWITHNRALGQT